jgi:putative membrane protein
MSRDLSPDLNDTHEATADPRAPWLRLHRDGLKVTALYTAGAVIAAGVPVAIGIGSGPGLLIALAFVIPGAALVTGAVVGYEAIRLRVTRYRVTDARVEMHTGVLFKTRRSLARERIRSVDLTANPLERLFGLAKVKVGTGETGSGSGSTSEQTLTLDSVDRAEADRLRAALLRRGTIEAGPDGEQRLATWEPGWLKYAPLSFLTPMLAGAAVGAVFQVAEWFGRGGLPVKIVGNLVEEHGPWTVLVVGLVALLIMGAIGSLALQGEAWWRHRLDREPGGTLRVRRGLLVARSLSLEEERIRGVELVEPLGVRTAGAGRLDVVAIGLKTDQEGSDLSTLVPAAPLEQTTAAAAAVIGPIAVELTGHPRAALRRRLRWALLAVVVLAGAAVAAHLVWALPALLSAGVVLAAVLASGFGVWTAVDSYRSLGHGTHRGYLVSRRGSTRRATVHLDRSGIIGWRITQSVFQRRMGLMTLDATTAAGKGHYAVIDADEHEILDFADEAVPDLLRPFLVRGELPERLELGGARRLLRADELLDFAHALPRVHGHGRQDPVVLRPERHELQGLDRTGDHDLVVGVRAGHEAEVLHAEVVLVGVEVRQFVVRVLGAEHRPRRVRAGVERGLPVLDADRPPVVDGRDAGDVAGRPDVRAARAQGAVHADAAAEVAAAQVDPGVDREADVRGRADGDEDGVGVDAPAVRGLDAAGLAVLADDAGDLGAAAQVDAVVGVELREDQAHLGAEDAFERLRAVPEDGDVAAELPGGGGDLHADPSVADDRDLLGGADRGGEQVGLLDGAEQVHALEVRAGEGERARAGAGGEEELLVVDGGAVGEGEPPGGGVEAGGGLAGAQVGVAGVPVLVDGEDLRAVDVAAEVVLRQRRPLVGPVGFAGDDGEVAVVAFAAEGLRGGGGGEAAADDDERCMAHWRLPEDRCGYRAPRVPWTAVRTHCPRGEGASGRLGRSGPAARRPHSSMRWSPGSPGGGPAASRSSVTPVPLNRRHRVTATAMPPASMTAHSALR